MIEFTIKLADKVIFINSNFETTKKYCKDYLFNGKPDFFVSIDEKDIDFEIKLNKTYEIRLYFSWLVNEFKCYKCDVFSRRKLYEKSKCDFICGMD